MLYYNFWNYKWLTYQMDKIIYYYQIKKKTIVLSYFFYKTFPVVFSIWIDYETWHGCEHHPPFMLQQEKDKDLGPIYPAPSGEIISPSVFQTSRLLLRRQGFTWTRISEVQMVSGPREILRSTDGKERDVEAETFTNGPTRQLYSKVSSVEIDWPLIRIVS